MKRLRPKQLNFIKKYIETGGNSRKAYMEAYGVNEPTADVCASRLLSNAKVNKELERLMTHEIDINEVIATLDRKLKNHAEQPKFSREELMAMRMALECAGKIGSGNKTAVQVNVGEQQKEYFDIRDFKTDISNCKKLFPEELEVIEKMRTSRETKQIVEEVRAV